MKWLYLTASILASGSLGATDIKLDMAPGLWQQSYKIFDASGLMETMQQEPIRQLASLPEAQQQMMEAMLKKQAASMTAQSGSAEVCISAEEINQFQLSDLEDFAPQLTQIDNKRYSFSFACTTEPASSGSGKIIFTDNKHYTRTAVFMIEYQSKNAEMRLEQEDCWLKADCQ